MDHETLSKLVALTKLDGVGDKRAYELYQFFGDVAQIYEAPFHRFENFPYVTEQTHRDIQALTDDIEAYQSIFDHCTTADITVIGVDDERYPQSLHRHHRPLVIYARGNLDALARDAVSFAGSREATDMTIEWTQTTAQQLASEGYVIVSGGARGVDTAAHRGALEGAGQTIVVLGTGLENLYPPENEALFHRILEADGLLLSHRLPDAEPTEYGFLQRNKTNAALGNGIVIVATDGAGGTMSQYHDAINQDRPIFVPDPALGLAPTTGIEKIVTTGQTQQIRSAAEISQSLSESSTVPPDSTQSSLGTWE